MIVEDDPSILKLYLRINNKSQGSYEKKLNNKLLFLLNKLDKS